MVIPQRISPSLEPVELSVAHYRLLAHHKRGGIVAGWEYWDDRVVRDLEAMGLLRGRWIGGLDMSPRPYWSNTDAGDVAAAAWDGASS